CDFTSLHLPLHEYITSAWRAHQRNVLSNSESLPVVSFLPNLAIARELSERPLDARSRVY
ncbi:MAG: hypothetical protein AAB915_00075, partial [Patescibacteria group bacterium]